MLLAGQCAEVRPLLICLLLFFPTFVGNFEHICNQMFIDCNRFLSQPCKNSFSFNLINVERRGVLHYSSNNPTNPTLDAHFFSSSPILTQVVILSNSWIYVYSVGVKINLFGFSESIDLAWCTIVLLLCFFLLNLDRLSFEELGIINGVDFAIGGGVRVIVCFNSWKK